MADASDSSDASTPIGQPSTCRRSQYERHPILLEKSPYTCLDEIELKLRKAIEHNAQTGAPSDQPDHFQVKSIAPGFLRIERAGLTQSSSDTLIRSSSTPVPRQPAAQTRPIVARPGTPTISSSSSSSLSGSSLEPAGKLVTTLRIS